MQAKEGDRSPKNGALPKESAAGTAFYFAPSRVLTGSVNALDTSANGSVLLSNQVAVTVEPVLQKEPSTPAILDALCTASNAPSTVPDAPSTVSDTNSTVSDTNSTVSDTNSTVSDTTNSTVSDTNNTVPDAPSTVSDTNSTVWVAPSTVSDTNSIVSNMSNIVPGAPDIIMGVFGEPSGDGGSRDPRESQFKVPLLTDIEYSRVAKRLWKSYMDCYGAARHQIESFDQFVGESLPLITQESGYLLVISKRGHLVHEFVLENVQLEKPMTREHEARIRDVSALECRNRALTYAFSVLCDVRYTVWRNPCSVSDFCTDASAEESEAVRVAAEHLRSEVSRTAAELAPEEGAVARDNDGAARPWNRYTSVLYTRTRAEYAAHIATQLAAMGWKCVKSQSEREMSLCRIPAMVRSLVCHERTEARRWLGHESPRLEPGDPGGYFVVNGNAKVLVAQEKLRTNYAFVFAVKEGNRHHQRCEVRSWNPKKLRSTSNLYISFLPGRGEREAELRYEIPFVPRSLPPSLVFGMLGVYDQAAVVSLVVGETSGPDAWRGERLRRLIAAAMANAPRVNSREAAVAAIIRLLYPNCASADAAELSATERKRTRFVEKIMVNEFLPHVSLRMSASAQQEKAVFLAAATRKLLLVHMGVVEPDHRDFYGGKRLETAGMLMSLLFRQQLRSFVKKIKAVFLRTERAVDVARIRQVLKREGITAAFKYAMSKDSWGINKKATKSGVSQLVTPGALVSYLRKINMQARKQGKQTEPRQLDTSHYGIKCAVESPDGQSCGLIANMSSVAYVRIGRDADRLVECVRLTAGPALEPTGAANALVYVNGRPIGTTSDPHALRAALVGARRCGALPYDVSVHTGPAEVHVDCDPGCLMRFVWTSAGLQRLSQLVAAFDAVPPGTRGCGFFDFMLRSGAIDFLDKQEESYNCLVAQSWRQWADSPGVYTHMEVHASLAMLGLTASCIPFPDFNQGPRIIFQAGMNKQAMSGLTAFALDGKDVPSNALWYPQRPLAMTWTTWLSKLDRNPDCTTAIVAIQCQDGHNGDDAIILNRASVDRGMMRSSNIQVFKEEIKNPAEEYFRMPPAECRRRPARCYAKVEPDGHVGPGALVNQGDVLVVKTSRRRFTTRELVASSDDTGVSATPPAAGETKPRTRGSVAKTIREVYTDHSLVNKFRENRPGVVSRVQLSERDSMRHVRIQVRYTRVPELGDKFSSRHGQKGVIGTLAAPADLPFCEDDGLVPDLIINPHAIPSRMTIGQLVEMVLSTCALQRGVPGDASAFGALQRGSADAQDIIENEMSRLGFSALGKRRMRNGETGELLRARVFVGPCQYLKLRHMVSDKHHARGLSGPVQVLVRQPVERRAKNGGHRFGEMERDATLSHGAPFFCWDRLFVASDPAFVYVCRNCQRTSLPPTAPDDRRLAEILAPLRLNKPYCPQCRSDANIYRVPMPYACKLFFQELQGLHIDPAFEVEPASLTEVFDL